MDFLRHVAESNKTPVVLTWIRRGMIGSVLVLDSVLYFRGKPLSSLTWFCFGFNTGAFLWSEMLERTMARHRQFVDKILQLKRSERELQIVPDILERTTSGDISKSGWN